MSPSNRKLLLSVHVWAGLIVGSLLILVAVSGAVLVFRPQLERRLDPRRFIVAPGESRLSLDFLAQKAAAARPGVSLESTRYYGDPTMPVLMYFSDKRYVHLNPYTGEVLGLRQRYGEGFGWFEGLHKYVQISPSDAGETVTGTASMIFVGIILSGVVLWWPATRRALRAGLTLNFKLTGRPWNLNLHKAVGIYAAVIILFSASSGGPIAFEWLKNGLYVITGTTRERPPAAPADPAVAFVGFEKVADQLHALVPQARESYISLPKGGIVSTYAIAADAPHPNARSYLWVRAGDATIVRQKPYAEASRGFRLYYWLLSLHTAMLGGPLVQLLLFVGALAVPLLAYTGVASYLRRKFGRAPVRPATIPDRPSPAASAAARRPAAP